MKFNKWQIVGIVILSLAFFAVYSCKSKFNKREAEKALIRHEIKNELEKRKDHIKDRVIDKIKPNIPHPFE